MAGLPVPVVADAADAVPLHAAAGRWPHRFPMLIDPGGVHWRHDDPVEPGGADRIDRWRSPSGTSRQGENFAADEPRWTREFYPAMVRRVPALAGVSRRLWLVRALRDDAGPQPRARRAPSAERPDLRQRLQRPRADDVARDRRDCL